MPIAISVNMLRLRVTQRLPAAHEERPAGPQHDRGREHELNPVRQRRIDQTVAADEMAAHLQHDRRERQAPRRSRSAGSCRRARGSARRRGSRPRAPAPCRRSGRFLARPGGSPDASGRYRSCQPARRPWRASAVLSRYLAGSAANLVRQPPSRNEGLAVVVEAMLRRRGVDAHAADGIARAAGGIGVADGGRGPRASPWQQALPAFPCACAVPLIPMLRP